MKLELWLFAGFGQWPHPDRSSLSLPVLPAKASMPKICATRRELLDEGRKTFRHETFESEVFWGNALQVRGIHGSGV